MRFYIIIFILLSQLSLSGQDADSVRGAQLYENGMAIYKSRQYKEAILVFRSALNNFTTTNPKAYSQTLVRMGIAYSLIPNYDSAIFYFKLAEPLARQVLEETGDYFVIINQQMQLAFTYYELRKFEEALPIFNETERLILNDSLNYYLLAYISGSKGRMCVKSGDFDKGQEYLSKAVEYARLSENSGALVQALNVNSSYHLENGSLAKAKEINEEIIRIYGNQYGYDHIAMAVIYSLQGRIEMQFEEYERAQNWLLRALRIHEKYPEEKVKDYAYNLYNLGIAYNDIGDHRIALQYLNQSIEKYKKAKVEGDFLLPVNVEKAKALTNLGEYKAAENIFDSMELYIQKAELTVLIKTEALIAKAFFLGRTDQLDMARLTYKEVIDILNEKFTNKNSPLAKAYYQFSLLESKKGNFNESMELINKAIENNYVHIDGGSEVISVNNHISFLLQKSEIQAKSPNDGRVEALAKSFQIIEDCIDFIQDYKRKSVGSDFSNFAITSVRESALKTSFELFLLTQDSDILKKAFGYSDLTKSQQLSEWLSIASNNGLSNISRDKISLGKDLQTKMTLYKNFIQSEKNLPESDPKKIQRYTDSLTSISARNFEHIELLKKQNPLFFKTIYENTIVSLNELRNALDHNEQLISFNLTDMSVYAFVVGDSTHFIKLETSPDEINQLVNTYRSKLTDKKEGNFEETGRALYERLILPLKPFLTAQNINIISDGVLNYLPIELLISDNEQNELKYLCEEYNITYSYSANVLLNEKKLSNSGLNSMVAYAPEFSVRKNEQLIDPIRAELSQLPGAFQEANKVSELFNGETLLGADASETRFKIHSKMYDFIHLATHAVVDEEFPEKSKLVFDLNSDSINDGYLHAYEIYNLDLNAQLVTLSACNTGFGKIQKGEGVMSLSRAFAYAGVPATVVSLWPASDKSTPELMKYFYQNLKDGQAKDVALNNARKQYLSTAQGKARHPFYWGGFVLIGDNSPIEEESNLLIYLIASTLVIVLIVTVLRKRRSHS